MACSPGQVKVQKQWETATPAVRQGVEERLCMQLRSLADGCVRRSALTPQLAIMTRRAHKQAVG